MPCSQSLGDWIATCLSWISASLSAVAIPTFMGKDDELRVMDNHACDIYAMTSFHHRKPIKISLFWLSAYIIDIEYSTRLMKHNMLSLLFPFAMNNDINISCLFNESTYISLTVIVRLNHCHTIVSIILCHWHGHCVFLPILSIFVIISWYIVVQRAAC